MNRAEVLLLLDELLELNPGTLQGPELVQEWDSIAVIGLIALADERFAKALSARQLQEAHTVDGLVAMLMAQ